MPLTQTELFQNELHILNKRLNIVESDMFKLLKIMEELKMIYRVDRDDDRPKS